MIDSDVDTGTIEDLQSEVNLGEVLIWKGDNGEEYLVFKKQDGRYWLQMPQKKRKGLNMQIGVSCFTDIFAYMRDKRHKNQQLEWLASAPVWTCIAIEGRCDECETPLNSEGDCYWCVSKTWYKAEKEIKARQAKREAFNNLLGDIEIDL